MASSEQNLETVRPVAEASPMSRELVQALLNCLNGSESPSIQSRAKAVEWIKIFKQAFSDTRDNGAVTLAISLVRKLITTLESIQEFENESFGSSLEVFTRSMTVRLERASGESGLIDRSDELKMETLFTVRDLERHIYKMVTCQAADNHEERADDNYENQGYNQAPDESYNQASDDSDEDEVYDATYRELLDNMYDYDDSDISSERRNNVLKQQFSALIPAYDPRSGRANLRLTQQFEIPSPDSPRKNPPAAQPRLQLFFKAIAREGGNPVMVPLTDPRAAVFCYFKQLITKACDCWTAADLDFDAKAITCKIVYKELKEEVLVVPEWSVRYVQQELGSQLAKREVIAFLQQHASPTFLRRWKLTGTVKSIKKTRNCAQLVCAFKEFCEEPHVQAPMSSDSNSDLQATPHSMDSDTEDVLNLLWLLYVISREEHISGENILGSGESQQLNIPDEEFVSQSLTAALKTQLQDPLLVGSDACPEWCEKLTRLYPMLLSLETRQLYFTATAFGASRAIMFLQENGLQEHDIEGQLINEFVTIPRDHRLLDWTTELMKSHADRKTLLQIEFRGELGAGPGPTREFYTLVGAELQCAALGLWLCDDTPDDQAQQAENGENPPGYYVQRSCGLFPSPIPQDHPRIEQTESLYEMMGTFFAKCIQDRWRVDIPLSRPFLKLMCCGDIEDIVATSYKESSKTQSWSASSDSTPWYAGLLTQDDFMLVDPVRARFLQQLADLSAKKMALMADEELSAEERNSRLEELTLDESGTKVEDLCLTFIYNPSSTIYGFDSIELKPGGDNIDVTLQNIEEYVELVTDLCLCTGIQRQMAAFKNGIDKVFSIEKLFTFSPIELQLILCGQQEPQWTREDVINYTEPKLGYTRESVGFQRFVSVLVNMDGNERKAFLQFATGCSSLPPGGLANLQPRLTVVRTVGGNDGTYPSVNVCFHYLKLPEYSSEEILRERLLAATKEKAFLLS